MRLILFCFLISFQLSAQQYMSKTGEISFFSETLVENIQAVNSKSSGVVDLKSEAFAFKVKITDFIFPNSLMQEHFNESYLESDKYPYSTFTGTITDLSDLDLSQKQRLITKGVLSIHGQSKTVEIESFLQRVDGTLQISSNFQLQLEDYAIDIPKIMMYKIAEVIDVEVDFNLININDE